MGRTSIDIEDDVHGDLKKLKADLGLKTLGDVVRVLLDNHLRRVPAARSDDDDGDVRAMEKTTMRDSSSPTISSRRSQRRSNT